MGGAARIVRRVFSPPAYTPPPAQVVAAAPAAKTTVSGAKKKLSVGQGSGVTGTIMTDATGIEEEANVSKTVLGGTTTKKKKYKV
jgi:hypothetical protein|tara:strand:+ start:58 stop:312 length:255 start_codon:yes stop_codon:yes gene_type:complete